MRDGEPDRAVADVLVDFGVDLDAPRRDVDQPVGRHAGRRVEVGLLPVEHVRSDRDLHHQDGVAPAKLTRGVVAHASAEDGDVGRRETVVADLQRHRAEPRA